MKKLINYINTFFKIFQRLSVNSIRTKLLCVLIVILTLPMIIGIIHAVRTFEKFAEGQAHEKVESDLAHSRMIFENKKKQIETLTKSIAMDNAVKVTVSLGSESLLGKQLEKYLTKFIKKDIIDLIIITDAQSEIMAKEKTEKLQSYILPEKEFIEMALKGDPIVSSYAISKNEFLKEKIHSQVTAEPVENNFEQYMFIIAACPLNYNNRTVGVVTTACLLNKNRLFMEEMIGESEITFALFQKDQIVLTNMTDQEGNLLFGRKINLFSYESEIDHNKYFGKTSIEQRDYIFHSDFLYNIKGEKTAILAVFKDADAIKAIKTETIKGMVLILVLGLILVIILVILVGYHFTKPIKKLVKRTEMIARGDLSSPIIIKSKDEIGILAESFNRMTEVLKTSQEELISARDYTDNIIRSMNDLLIVVSSTGNIQTVNAAVCDLLGYNENELIGQPVSNIFAERTMPVDNAWLQDLVNKGCISNVEKVYLSKNGEKIPVLFSGSIMRSKDEKVQGIVLAAIDITERKQAEKALQDSEEKYRTLIESSSDAIMSLDEKGFLSCNSATLKIFGCAHKEEFLSKHPSEFSPVLQPGGQDSLTFANEKIMTAFQTGKNQFEWLHKRLDGKEFPVEVLLTSMELGGEKILQAVVRDITERKQAEEALRASEGKLNAMIQSIGDYMSMMDQDLNIIWANETAKRNYGNNIIGKKCYKAYYNRNKPCEPFPCLTLKAFKDGQAHDDYTQMINKDGEIRYFHCTANVALREEEEEGKAIAVMEVSRDITEHKQSEEALSKAHGQLKGVLNSATQVSIISTDPNGLITVFNPGAERMLGYSTEEMAGKQTPEIIHLESEVIEHGQKLSEEFGYPIAGFDVFITRAKHGGYEEGEWTYIKKDGTHILVNLVVTAMRNKEGLLTGFLGVAQDITERKQSERQIKASLKEKEVMLKEIHHRVKNNLQIITSLLNLQSRNIKDEEALMMFRDSQSRVKSMALIHEKLYQSEDLARIDFSEYTRNLTNYLLRSFESDSNRIKLNLNVDKILLGVDTAVPCGLIVNELVSNSLKHAFEDRENCEINIDFSGNDDSGFILAVSDNGSGFPDKIDFQQTDSLGLQLVNTLSRQLGGVIRLDVDYGTKFMIAFPIPKMKEEGVKACQKVEC